MAVREVVVIAYVTVMVIYVSLFLPQPLIVVKIINLYLIDIFLNDNDDDLKTIGNIYVTDEPKRLTSSWVMDVPKSS